MISKNRHMYVKILEDLFCMSVFTLPLGAGAARRAQSEKQEKSILNNLLARALGMLLGVAGSVQEYFPSCLLLGKNDISAPASLYPPLGFVGSLSPPLLYNYIAEVCCQAPSRNCQ